MAAHSAESNPHEWRWLGPIVFNEALTRHRARHPSPPWVLTPKTLGRLLEATSEDSNVNRRTWKRLQKLSERIAQNPPQGYRVQVEKAPYRLIVTPRESIPLNVATQAPAPASQAVGA